jgi:hypothetical protein
MFRFKCACCDEWHEGMPSFGTTAPDNYFYIPEAELPGRCELTSDTCVIDDEDFFVRGCIEIPVKGAEEPFQWGAWVSLSRQNFQKFVELLDSPIRAHHGPYFGWLSVDIGIYPCTANLKTMVHLRDNGMRPSIQLEPTDHPLAVEQREGISIERVAEIYTAFMHPTAGAPEV